MDIKHCRLIVLLLFCIALCQTAIAASDFQASARHASLGLCSCGEYKTDLMLKNTGTDILSIDISTVLDPKWVTSVPKKIVLQKGEQKSVYLYMDVPCDITGEYALKTKFTSGSITKQLDQMMVIKKCSNTQIAMPTQEIQTCPCKKERLTFELRNIGAFDENYILNVSPYSDNIKISNSSFTLEKNSRRNITIDFDLPCDTIGLQTFNLVIYAQKNDILSKLPIEYNISSCYDFAVQNTDNEISLCRNAKKTYSIQVENKGDIDNIYNISTNLDWVKSMGSLIKIEKKSTKDVNIIIFPDSVGEGIYDLAITTRSMIGGLDKVINKKIDITECYQIDYDKNDLTACEGNEKDIGFTIKNLDDAKKTVQIVPEGLDWIKIKDPTIDMLPGQESRIMLSADAPSGLHGKHSMILKITDGKETIDYPMIISVIENERCSLVGIYSDSDMTIGHTHVQLPFVIENKGILNDEFSLAIDTGSWITLEKNEIDLKQGEKSVLYFDLDPGSDIPDGKYGVDLQVKSKKTGATYEKTFIVKLSDRKYMPWVLIIVIAFVSLIAIISILNRRKDREIIKVQLMRDESNEEKQTSLLSIITIGFVIMLSIAGYFIFIYIKKYSTGKYSLLIYYAIYVIVSVLILAFLVMLFEKGKKKDHKIDIKSIKEKKLEQNTKSRPNNKKVEQKIQKKTIKTTSDIVDNFSEHDKAESKKLSEKTKKQMARRKKN